MDTQLLIADYIANGGTVTQLPDGVAEDALDCTETRNFNVRNKRKVDELELYNLMHGLPRLFKTEQEIQNEG